jgi:xanthine/uracil permease
LRLTVLLQTPNTTLSQNNGVLALTRCASRTAGYACAGWLCVFGCIAKIGAFIVALPECVLGGLLAFLFTTVAVSGIRLMTLDRMDRRARFVLAMSLTIGMGTALCGPWSQPLLGVNKGKPNQLWPVMPGMSEALESFRWAAVLLR